jgi:hypothetical protein
MATMTRARAVLEAAWHLDRLKPGWWKPRRFSLRRLNIADCDNCILGQVFEKDAKKVEKGRDGFFHALYDAAADGGGTALVPSRIGGFSIFASGECEADWRRLILRRRARARSRQKKAAA